MKSFLNTRQYDILTALLKEDSPKTVGELSNALDMHPRVVQYNLNAIAAWLESNHARIIRRSGVGLRIELTQQRRDELLRQLSRLDNIELVLSTEQRRRCMLLRLLTAEQPISSGKLASEFGISPTTVISDLMEVSTDLQTFRLELARTLHKGFHVEGRRSLKRFAMCVFYCEEHYEDKVPLGDIQKLIPSKPPFDYLASEWFEPSDMELAGKAVRRAEQLLKTDYSQASRIFLQYYLVLLLTDMRRGTQVTRKPGTERREFRESLVLPAIRAVLEHHAGQPVNEGELQLLVLHLHCLSAFERPGADDDGKQRKTGERTAYREETKMGEALIKEIALCLHPYLQVDEIFRTEVIGYLDRCLAYRQMGFVIPNPFHEKARTAFSETYDIIEQICSKKEYFIDDPLSGSDLAALSVITTNALERIPQIAQRDVRVALISDADDALTVYTRVRILNKFPWFRIIGVFRECDAHRLASQAVDLILSTVENHAERKPSTISIDPFVTDADVEHIKNWIDENVIEKGSRLKSRGTPGLGELLSPRNIVLGQEVRSWEEAVYVVGKPLVQNGDLSRSYLDAIIAANKQYGPYSVVSPHIALLHAKPTDGVRNLCAGLMILKKGVDFGAPKFDPVHLVFILGMPDSHSHLHALYELASLIRTKSVWGSLRQCKSAEEAMQSLLANSRGQ